MRPVTNFKMSALTETKSLTGAFTAEAFAAHLERVQHLPAWWLDRQRAAYDRFASLPMPRRTDEGWRFSNLSTLTLEGFVPSPEKSAVPAAISAFGAVPREASLIFTNNVCTQLPEVSAELAARGVIVTTLARAVIDHPKLLTDHFMAQPQKLGSEKFSALHAAFVENGAFIYVPKHVVVPAPILIGQLATGAGTAVFPHALVVAEEHAQVTVAEYFVSADGHAHFACGANDLYAGHGAQLTYIAAQNWSRETLSFQFNATVARRDARVLSLNLHLGARQARHESFSQLQAPGAHSEMLALTVAHGAQEFDQRTLQVHQAPDTSSNLLYKNALLDQAKTIFSGLIVVDPDAQKTDAYQSNRNLMLSDEAEANSLPGLEIQANDVRCTHGATTARIDREQEFYLKSRGIPAAQAQELLVFGFFEEILGQVANPALHDALAAVIREKFQS